MNEPNLIQHGINQKLISLNEDNKTITYCFQDKKRNYQNPEEQVQAETFLRLILEYGYSVKRIRQYESVQMGSSKREADIMVYNDDECKSPYIIVECKHQEVTQAEFDQAIEQAFSYSGVYPTAKYVWVISKLLNAYFEYLQAKPLERQTNTLADIPHFNSDSTPDYKYVYDPTDTRFTDLKQITEAELKRIFKQSHDALWAGGQLNPSQAFDELDKLIFCKIWDEKNTSPNQPYKFQIYKQDSPEQLQQRILSLYEEGKKKDASVFDKPIGLSADRIKTVVSYFESVNLSETDLDSKGAAFEAFLGAYFRGDFGQFFTPCNVVKFIIEVLPITNAHRVLDTSCGSGGFLLYALDKVRKQADNLFPNYKTDVNHQKKWFAAWHDFAQFRLFGI